MAATDADYRSGLWRMADALRGSMDAAETKHVVLPYPISGPSRWVAAGVDIGSGENKPHRNKAV